MKKVICCLLVVVLVTAFVCPMGALAAEPKNPFPPLWDEWGYDSLEEFLETMGIDYEEYEEWEEDYYSWWKEYQEETKSRRQREVEEMGGIPGITNVMYNGQFIKFTNAVPEITGGTTFVPAKPFLEALGGKVSYVAQTRAIVADFGDYSLRFVIGEKTIRVIEERGIADRETDVAPYIKDNTAYIPARAVAEVLGLDVYWDSGHKSVVIIDTKGLAAEIDKNFTVANRLLKMRFAAPDEGGVYKYMLDIRAFITQFNTLDGDTNGIVKTSVSIISDGKSFSMKGVANLSWIMDMIMEEYMSFSYLYEDEIPMMTLLRDSLKDAQAEMIYDYDEDTLYFRAPLLSGFIPDLPDDAWIVIKKVSNYSDYAGLDSMMEEYGGAIVTDVASISAVILEENSFYQDYYAIYLYKNISSSAASYKALIGDDKFTKSGDDYTLVLKLDDVKEIFKTEYYNDAPTEFDLKLTIKTSDDTITDLSGSFVCRMDSRYSFSPDMRVSAEFSINLDDIKITAEVHVKNTFKVNFELFLKTEKTGEPVPKAPPQGDTVIPIEKLFPDGSYLTGDTGPKPL